MHGSAVLHGRLFLTRGFKTLAEIIAKPIGMSESEKIMNSSTIYIRKDLVLL